MLILRPSAFIGSTTVTGEKLYLIHWAYHWHHLSFHAKLEGFGCQTSLSFKASPAKGHNDMKPEISQKWQCKNTTCFGVFEMLFFKSKWVGYVFLTASCSPSNYWNTLQHGCYLLLTSRGWYRPFLLFSWFSLSVFIQSADETPAHLASQNSKT